MQLGLLLLTMLPGKPAPLETVEELLHVKGQYVQPFL